MDTEAWILSISLPNFCESLINNGLKGLEFFFYWSWNKKRTKRFIVLQRWKYWFFGAMEEFKKRMYCVIEMLLRPICLKGITYFILILRFKKIAGCIMSMGLNGLLFSPLFYNVCSDTCCSKDTYRLWTVELQWFTRQINICPVQYSRLTGPVDFVN